MVPNVSPSFRLALMAQSISTVGGAVPAEGKVGEDTAGP